MQHRTSGIETYLMFKSCSSHPMRLNTCFQMRLNASYTNNYAVVQNNDSKIWGVADCSLVRSPSSQPPLFSTPLTIVKNNLFSATNIFHHYCTLHIFAQQWCNLTMTSFYCRLPNCQSHHAVQILVVSTMVLTIPTTHNTALGTTVPNAPHFLARQKSAHTSVYH